MLSESIKIENPQTDDFNDIFVDGEKVGYIILSPAKKEYYWVDINLPNPLTHNQGVGSSNLSASTSSMTS